MLDLSHRGDVMGERSTTLRALWARVNDLGGSAEDPSQQIRYLIAEAGIEPRMHIGRPEADFDGNADMIAEWALGNWADALDKGSPLMNSIRNASISFYEQTYGIEVHTS